MNIDDKNPLTRSGKKSETKKGKGYQSPLDKDSMKLSFKDKIMFWKKPDFDNDNVTFSSKREKAFKQRRNRIAAMICLFLMVGGGAIGAVASGISRLNMAHEQQVDATKISDSPNDAAAKQILKGKQLTVEDKKKEVPTIEVDKANKMVEDAVKAQADKDKEQLDKTNADKSKTQEQIDSLTKANQDLTSQNDDLHKQLDAAKSNDKTSDYQKQIDSYKSQVADLEAKLKAAQSKEQSDTTPSSSSQSSSSN